MTKRTRAVLTTCLGIGLALFPHTAPAQAVYGSVFGTVTDASGAAIPGATVTVTDENKGTSVTAKSNESGGYTVEHLIPDLYTVKVEMAGFKSFETNHLQVLADTSPKVDAAMQAGGASQTVTVNADAIPQLKTDRADVATTFDQKTVADLPIAGRNFTALQLLLPGAQQLGWSHAADENPQGSQQIQVDGQAFGGVAYELDGTDNQDPILGIIVVNPALDAITEAKIATQNFDAEFGKAVSAVVTVQTKSGTNSFHGSAFDYRRSNANLARNPFTQSTPNVVTGQLLPNGLYNEFGGSIGGPIKKDRAFFFGDYQGVRQNTGTSAQLTVPSARLVNSCLSGAGCDFSEYQAVLSPNKPLIYDPSTGQPYANNIIPNSQLSPQALGLLKLLQPFAPNVGTAGTLSSLQNNYAASGSGLFNNDQWDVRVDFQATQKIHAFGRFSRFTDTLSGTTIFGPAGGPGFGINNYGGTSVGANDSAAAGADIAVNATLLTDFRLGYYRYGINTSKFDQGTNFAQNLGIPGVNLGTNFTSGASGFNLADVGSTSLSPNPSNTQSTGAQYGSDLNITRCNCPLSEHEDQYQIVNNWTKIISNHSMKFGADLRYARNLRVPSDVDRAGQFSFGNGPTSSGGAGGLGFATFVLGDVTNFARYFSNTLNAKEFQKRVFFYAQDTWRATPNLTINAGVRWELYFPETVNGAGQGGLMHLDTGYITVAGIGHGTNMGWGLATKAIAPRIGFAYQLNPQTVIRAGYGRSFDLGVFGSVFGHTATQNLPVLLSQSINPTGGQTTAAFNLAQGPSLPNLPLTPSAVPANGLIPSPGYVVNTKARPDPLRLPTLDAWNLSIQRSITPTLSVTAAYVGNKGTHTLSAGDGNNTNPNEAAIFLPAQFSTEGRPLHYTSSTYEVGQTPDAKGIYPDGGTNNQTLLQRYYGGTLPACQNSAYITQATQAGALAGLPAGSCGWTSAIQFNGDDQDTHFNALQVTLAKQLTKGLSFTSNYAWQSSFNWSSTFVTWNRTSAKGRDDSLRQQQIVVFGTYELPFGRNHLVGGTAPGYVNEIIGGWQLSPVLNWSSGLPFTVSYAECGQVIPSDAPCYVNGDTRNLKVNVGKLNPITHNRLFFHGTTTPLTQQPFSNLSAPGLDQIGTGGRNGDFGPNFFNTDLAVQKDFPIHENILAQFRMDAYNVFNHMSLANPGSGFNAGTIVNVDSGDQFISSLAPSQFPTRQLQFSLRVQF
jgi:Carboxypeptidase regulatory-like domain/TonB dependent receptor